MLSILRKRMLLFTEVHLTNRRILSIIVSMKAGALDDGARHYE